MDQRTDFLWETLRLMENRIAMIDTKSSLLIAIETGIFALIAFVIEKGFLGEGSQITFVFTAIFAGVVIALLLQTIRPSDHCFGRKESLEHLASHNMLWPSQHPTKEKFTTSFANITEEKAEEELKGEIFVRHQLLRRKYRTY
jgi:hypothetical protein